MRAGSYSLDPTGVLALDSTHSQQAECSKRNWTASQNYILWNRSLHSPWFPHLQTKAQMISAQRIKRQTAQCKSQLSHLQVPGMEAEHLTSLGVSFHHL